ncbi:MAG TPA: hypothetical protein VE545_05260 [Candidatus Dormibacteraeota bacterium]|nr:hypothetical protein [Candidatus Dormibacteraeota bacterium]
MRLLAPAALLAFLFLVNLAPDSAAGSRASFFEEQPPAILQSNNANATGLALLPPGQQPQENVPVAAAAPESARITLPTGTRVTLALTSPIWAKTAKPGDAVYAVTAFPVVRNNSMAIPVGTYVLGEIDAVTKPGWRNAHALFQVHFSKIIFTNGYTLELASAPAQGAAATVHVEVTSRNDVLLDNGAQFDMVVQTPLTLDANKIAEAVRHSRPLPIGPTPSATLCRTIPATPGTSDTVIPGTPPTPDTTIPGPDGTSTTIPGSPGTPPTIIPGTPGTPEIPCPAPPAVVSGLSGPQIHTQTFQVTGELTVSGTRLSPGSYQVMWLGTGAAVQVDLLRNRKAMVRAAAHIAALPGKSIADKVLTRTNPDGSASIASLEFAGESFAVIFD